MMNWFKRGNKRQAATPAMAPANHPTARPYDEVKLEASINKAIVNQLNIDMTAMEKTIRFLQSELSKRDSLFEAQKPFLATPIQDQNGSDRGLSKDYFKQLVDRLTGETKYLKEQLQTKNAELEHLSAQKTAKDAQEAEIDKLKEELTFILNTAALQAKDLTATSEKLAELNSSLEYLEEALEFERVTRADLEERLVAAETQRDAERVANLDRVNRGKEITATLQSQMEDFVAACSAQIQTERDVASARFKVEYEKRKEEAKGFEAALQAKDDEVRDLKGRLERVEKAAVKDVTERDDKIAELNATYRSICTGFGTQARACTAGQERFEAIPGAKEDKTKALELQHQDPETDAAKRASGRGAKIQDLVVAHRHLAADHDAQATERTGPEMHNAEQVACIPEGSAGRLESADSVEGVHEGTPSEVSSSQDSANTSPSLLHEGEAAGMDEDSGDGKDGKDATWESFLCYSTLDNLFSSGAQNEIVEV